jgi:trk system potassium uptake protein TrkH
MLKDVSTRGEKMRPYLIIRYIGFTLLLNAGFLLIAAIISGLNSDTAFFPLLYTFIIATLFGIFPILFVPGEVGSISNKEGLAIVVYSWILSCSIGTLPFVLWGGEFTFTNAWFESVSGYTTTGSSILTDIEALPLGLLFWRSVTHWIGGIGIVIFALAVLPHLSPLAMVLYRAEGPDRSLQMFIHIGRRSVQILLRVYVGLTLVETVALLFCGISLFDAITTSFATIATGGFSSKNMSIAYYGSSAVEITVMVFMIFSGMNFVLLFEAISGKPRALLKSSTLRYYLFALIIGVALTTLSVHGSGVGTWIKALRYSAFQVISIGTSTGFATTDSSIWPPFAQLVLLFFTFQCACSSSTSGGIKADRIVLFLKSVARRLKQERNPRAVIPIRLDGKAVEDGIASLGALYICLYVGIVVVSTGLLTAMGVDGLSAFSGSAATMGNVGPGLGTVGSASNFAHIPSLGKWVLSVTMLVGRLEIYGLIICLIPYYRR